MKIKNRFTNEVIYENKNIKSIKELVEEAISKKISLSEANLSEANLSEANLFKANLLFCKMDKEVSEYITKKWFEWEVYGNEIQD